MATKYIIIQNKIIKINETQQVVSGELNRNPETSLKVCKSLLHSSFRIWICLRHLGLYKDKSKM